MPNPTSPSIPREFLGGVGFFFSLFLDFPPQEHGIFLARNSAVLPLFQRRCSNDGLSMEYPWTFKGNLTLLFNNNMAGNKVSLLLL